MNIARILCPIDFSDTSVHAVDLATTIASWYKARIAALHEDLISHSAGPIAWNFARGITRSGTSTKSRGSGLGLPTAKRLIEAHNGQIAIECPPAGGTSVLVRLPL